jgi:hypothetical protein
MPSRRRVTGWGATIAAGMIAVLALAAEPRTIARDFDSDTAGGEPGFFRFDATAGLPANTWRAMPSADAFSRPFVAVQTATSGVPGHFHFALSSQAGRFENGHVQAAAKRAAARGFARGGVVARYAGPGDFVAALVDFQSQTVALISVRGGKAETLGVGPIVSNEPVWRSVRLAAAGRTLQVFVSGRKALEAADPGPRPGEAGLISEAPVPVAFDDLTISIL